MDFFCKALTVLQEKKHTTNLTSYAKRKSWRMHRKPFLSIDDILGIKPSTKMDCCRYNQNCCTERKAVIAEEYYKNCMQQRRYSWDRPTTASLYSPVCYAGCHPQQYYLAYGSYANQFYVRGQYNKRKRMRASFTHEQVLKLQKVFQTKKYLGNSERTELAQKLKMTEQQIKIWFQNRRYKEKKQQQSEERHRLCSRVPTNMSHSGLDHDRVNDIGRYVKSEAEEYVEID